MKCKTAFLIMTAAYLTVVPMAVALEHYYRVPLRQLELDHSLPADNLEPGESDWAAFEYIPFFAPYGIADDGRISIDFEMWHSVPQMLDSACAVIESTSTVPSGTLFIPRADLSGMERYTFKLKQGSMALNADEGAKAFHTAMQRHYDRLLQKNFAGGAWFRYQSMKAATIMGQTEVFDPNVLPNLPNAPTRDPFEDSAALFTGMQAISENIQLDRVLQTTAHQPRTVDLSSIEGITTSQIDWKSAIEGITVEPDPLAAYIPADQHAFFYPTFRRMMDFVDALKGGRQTLEPIGFSVSQLEFYEQQMCVWLDGWSRFWGPKTIRGVALTGSDPYMAEGTDSAILFDASIGKLVFGNTESKQENKLKEIKQAQSLKGTIEGVSYQAVVSPDRRVCSYLAQINNVVVVTNSLSQLQKIVEASQKKRPRMADQDEYKFFRHRYAPEKNDQTAFVVMTDAAIRRWCSPRWRIGAARRAVAAAALSHMQATWIDQGDSFDLNQAQVFLQGWMPDIGKVTVTQAGITSSVYGNLKFLTPIADLLIDKVSVQEQQQYERFRSMYQRQWRDFFDPIAICFLHEPEQTKLDLTIRPLITESEYQHLRQIGGRNTIKAADGDPHPESIAHLIIAIDKDSEPVRQAGQFVLTMMPMTGEVNALGWLGRWITVYADEGAFWKGLSDAYRTKGAQAAFETYIENNVANIPVAVAADVENPVKLAAFIVALRAWIEQAVPKMTSWQALAYKEQAYTKVVVRSDPNTGPMPAVFYAVLHGQLVISPSESLIQRAIDRSLLKKKPDSKNVWAGQNIAVRISEKGWDVMELLAGQSYARFLQRQSWENLPILTEWHARKGKLTESEFHNRFWYPALTSPAGTEYAWNERWNTMQSTLFGHPGDPKIPAAVRTPLVDVRQADIGITFEQDGLRAVVNVDCREK